MKITDLKPNQAIEISNSKEARKFSKITKMYVNIGDILSFSHNCWFFSPKAPVILPASKFLKLSLNKRVKALERKIKVLEKGSDFMQEINNIEVNSDLVANCNDVPVNKYLTELPEKWRVDVTESNKQMLMNWAGLRTINPLFIYSDKTWSGNHSINKEYTEISTEDFKRLVIKENVLVENTWYIYSNGAIMFNVSEGKGYGINKPNNDWVNEASWLSNNENGTDYRLATPEEIKTTLVNEAEKRGFKVGVRFKLNKDYGYEFENDCRITYSDQTNTLTLSSKSHEDGYGKVIFKNGIWAEIVEPAKESEIIDWSKSNILEHKGHGNPYLVLSNPIAKQNDFTFFGTVIIPSNDYTHSRYGEYIYLEKSSFKLYKGEPITLKND